MKSIAFHDIDPASEKKFAERRLIFADLFGVWSEEDQAEFDARSREFEQIDQ